jgi:hypothetical protein
MMKSHCSIWKRSNIWNLIIYSAYLCDELFACLKCHIGSGSGVARSEDGFMEACECNSGCTAAFCSCQDDSEILEDDGTSKAFAYDANVGVALRCLICRLTNLHMSFRAYLHLARLSRAMSSNATR